MRRPQADVVISGCEIATVAARLRNDAIRYRRLFQVTEIVSDTGVLLTVSEIIFLRKIISDT